jgi:NADH:ubiquinone oxidoreductase subunit 6 (subunit J)
MFWHYFLLLVLCTVFVLISENPVHSVLFLILTFCISAAILFIFNVELVNLCNYLRWCNSYPVFICCYDVKR